MLATNIDGRGVWREQEGFFNSRGRGRVLMRGLERGRGGAL